MKTTAFVACALLSAAEGNAYYVRDSTNPTGQGFDGATTSFVDYLYELAK